MITKTFGFKALVGTDKESIHETVEGAQKAEIVAIFADNTPEHGGGFSVAEIAEVTIDYKDVILNILTTGPKSRPKARAVNGAKRTRKPKVTAFAAPQQQSIPE